MLLVINSLGDGHTHTYQHAIKNDFKKPDMCGLQPCVFGFKKVDELKFVSNTIVNNTEIWPCHYTHSQI